MVELMNKETDIYFIPEYGKLYEEIENGELVEFKFESELGTVTNMFIKRKIDIKYNNEQYFDIVTPYGYGGPLIRECNLESDRKDLAKAYGKAFSKYCEEEKIVSEFIRFHPLLKNYEDFREVYEVIYMRKTVGTNLKDSDDPFQSEFSKKARQITRRAMRDGVEYEIVENPVDFESFNELYNGTMERNKADNYYYFGESYFNEMVEKIPSNIIIARVTHEGKILGEELYLAHGKFLHSHLVGTLKEYLSLSPAYVLKYAASQWGKENGYEMIHHGGGLTNGEDDSLLSFKKRFCKDTEFDFYIGKKVWSQEVYDYLVEETNSTDSSYFPKYRDTQNK